MDFQIVFSIDNLRYKTELLKVFLKKDDIFSYVDVFIDFVVIEKQLKILKLTFYKRVIFIFKEQI